MYKEMRDFLEKRVGPLAVSGIVLKTKQGGDRIGAPCVLDFSGSKIKQANIPGMFTKEDTIFNSQQ